MRLFSRTADYIRRNGVENTFYAAKQHLLDLKRDLGYEAVYEEERATREELAVQRQSGSSFGITISVIVPVFEPDVRLLREMAGSVIDQSYSDWELILSDGSGKPCHEAQELSELDNRIRYIRSKAGGGISENTNKGLNSSTGEMAAFLDQDDLLEKDALYRIAWAAKGGALVVYTDEDKLDGNTGRHMSPYRKPDYNQFLLYGNNYICHFLAVKRALALGLGGFRSRYDGAQDHDFVLRCCDAVRSEQIWHIPKILYHWRIHERSTAGNPGSKIYAYENGRRAVEDHLREKGFSCRVQHTMHRGFFRPVYSGTVSEEDFVVLVGKEIVPMTRGWKKILSSYFVRPDVGAVGGRVIDRHGRILCNGYCRAEDGKIRSLFEGMDFHLSGQMNQADLCMNVDAVSRYACLIRKDLIEKMDSDWEKMNSWKLCAGIRRSGYKILVDPEVVFRLSPHGFQNAVSGQENEV